MKNEIYEYQSLFSMSPRIVWSLSWLSKPPCPSKPLVGAICWYPIIVCIMYDVLQVHAFFYKQRFFFNSASMLLNIFSWIEFQMLLRCCLIHIGIIIVRHVFYILHLCLCLGLGLFMSYLFFWQKAFLQSLTHKNKANQQKFKMLSNHLATKGYF